ncbi:Palmitoyltransferase pfa5 [Neofusicoccum parvum]|uniref:Palmitoyltransferase n=2 Tax=Neofusicoccum parvum TaxID=310453 RepID=R1GY72_BOTPV|nr:putative palmitoyltransferase pfa5 protein [Neofusicoccum parvum UCRNP2]GME28870.1 Palmitoyltransferase pfa5 [Neofusicoccum parvum]GME64495.1 Palmitoyltransferase pfa5 [Neofusicoccum parvum]
MIVAIVSWATYVVIAKLAFDRLVSRGQRGAGVAVIVVYCLLLFATTVAYMRILMTIKVDPGTVPLGRASADAARRRRKSDAAARREKGRHHHRHGERKKSGGQHQLGHAGVFEDEEGRTWAERQHDEKMKRLEKFVPREVFVCDHDGLPLWVGGIVSETTMKFFIQFTFFGSFLALFILITDAILLARDRQQGHHINSHMAVLLGFGALFTLFAVGIFGNTFFLTMRNLTTVEALNRGNAVYNISILITPAWCLRNNDEQYPFRTTTYPGAPGALYAILMTKPGDNPWDLGGFKNLKSVMGESIIDWFLPFKFSPCTNHDRQDAEFEMGPVVEWVKKDATGY